MINIRKNNPEYRDFIRRKNEKNLRQRTKRKKRKYTIKKYTRKDKKPYRIFSVPKIFSILENPEETISFFNNVIKEIEKIYSNNILYIFLVDMEDVQKITGDALMYFLTVMRNYRVRGCKGIYWRGNFPKNEDISNFLKCSGFLGYLDTPKCNLMHTDENIQIKSGSLIEPNVMKSICDFTNDKLNTDRKYSRFLANMLTELMTNTKDHAYNSNNKFDFCWYVFVENSQDYIRYTFMDNGLGIPTTVNKRLGEKIKEYINIDKEYKYIESCLSGNFLRTETNLTHRGKGLPEINSYYNDNKMSNLTIISNHAYYQKNKSKDLINHLIGTIVYWEIDKNQRGDI
ncbi:putative uncharacterized protein [Clostridium sp. CAG:492]|nr:putative uncharacterized protein [Clostridium sp. CAG:492]